MSAHTPGPWVSEDEIDCIEGGCGIIASNSATQISNPSRGLVGWAASPKGDDDELLANARLIAAAPEGIAALKAVEKAWLDGLVSHPEFPIRQVRAAIAKAEGRK